LEVVLDTIVPWVGLRRGFRGGGPVPGSGRGGVPVPDLGVMAVEVVHPGPLVRRIGRHESVVAAGLHGVIVVFRRIDAIAGLLGVLLPGLLSIIILTVVLLVVVEAGPLGLVSLPGSRLLLPLPKSQR
jgi:hypothetical protein